MNTPTTPTPDLEGLRKAVQEYRPNPHRVPFNGLKPVHDFIVELRNRNVSYASIADLLQQHGVKTSRARVAEFGRIVLEGGKSRKRHKRARTMPVVNTLATPAPTLAPAGNDTPPPKENPAFVPHGPRIAKVEQLSPEDAKEFLDSLKPENAQKP